MNKKQFVARLRGLANSVDNEWIEVEQAYGTLLLYLKSAGYLEKKKEFYILNVK